MTRKAQFILTKTSYWYLIACYCTR